MSSVLERTTKADQLVAKHNLLKMTRLAVSFAKRSEPVSIEVNDHDLVRLELPAKVFLLLKSILDLMAEGKAFSLIPEEAVLSTQKAADILNVSRPHIVKLLESGSIPYKKVGAHRRIMLEDLLDYSTKLKAQRKKALQDLADQAQKHNLGY